MKITLLLRDKLVKELRKLAIDRDTTLTGLVREYLEKLAACHHRTKAAPDRGPGAEL